MSTSLPRLPRLIGDQETKVLRLHPLEKALLSVVTLHLIFLPWAAGGMKLWTQWISLGLGLTSFVLALIPRHYTDEHTGGGPFTLYPFRRLLRFPLFWLGLVFAAYMAIGALNPGWRYVLENGRWWMTRVAHIEWLPHGVTDVPLSWGSPWRSLIIFAAAFFLTCALWIGITRRRTLEILLLALLVNALLVSVFALIGRATGMTKLYWTWPASNVPFGPFIYRNHAAAWLNLMVGATAALAAIFHQRARRQMARSSPTPLTIFFAVCLAVTVGLSQSRGGVIALCCFLAAATAFAAWHSFRRPDASRLTAISALLAAAFLGFAALSFNNASGAQAWQRFTALFEDRDSSLSSRETATAATMDMWRESPWVGSGAASFRYVFPRYQQHYPSIYEVKVGRKTFRLSWEYAHNDWAQMLAEYGAIGSALAAAAIAWWLLVFFRRRAFAQGVSVTLALAFAATLLHARGEFVFRNPAVLLTTCVLAIAALRWAELSQGRRG